jgi:EAL domain-containing protein (putative c-di-GMP-specific phosphodiesterase class I)
VLLVGLESPCLCHSTRSRSMVPSSNRSKAAAKRPQFVRLVLGLGRGLNLPVLAEGVETSAELAFLESEFCNEAQGYLLGKPADIESYRRLTHGGEAFDERSAVIHLKARVKSM